MTLFLSLSACSHYALVFEIERDVRDERSAREQRPFAEGEVDPVRARLAEVASGVGMKPVPERPPGYPVDRSPPRLRKGWTTVAEFSGPYGPDAPIDDPARSLVMAVLLRDDRRLVRVEITDWARYGVSDRLRALEPEVREALTNQLPEASVTRETHRAGVLAP